MLIFVLTFKDQKNQYLFLNTYNGFISKVNKAMEVKKYWYPDSCPPPPEEYCPQLGLRFGPRWGLVLGLGGNQTIAPPENSPRLGLGFGLGLVLGLRGNFPITFTFTISYTSTHTLSYTSKQSLTLGKNIDWRLPGMKLEASIRLY